MRRGPGIWRSKEPVNGENNATCSPMYTRPKQPGLHRQRACALRSPIHTAMAEAWLRHGSTEEYGLRTFGQIVAERLDDAR